jgi:tryptophan-rich sensory protein
MAFWDGAITFAAAALGAWASTSAASFYATLALPAWAPPASVFGPVWTLLYAMMAIAAWLVWRSAAGAARNRRCALSGAAGRQCTVELAVLRLEAGRPGLRRHPCTDGAGVRDDRCVPRIRGCGSTAAAYLAWISFASALNFAVWRANPGLL